MVIFFEQGLWWRLRGVYLLVPFRFQLIEEDGMFTEVKISHLHGHASTENSSDGEVAAVARVARRHHVLGVEHLLRELGNGQRAVALRAAGGQRRKARHEEVQSREGNHVHRQLPAGVKWEILSFWRAKAISNAVCEIQNCPGHLRSALSCPGKRRQVVTPDMVADTRWLRSP